MANSITMYYSKYLKTKNNFNVFHNHVINMPRDAFSTVSLEKLQSLAEYLLLIENKVDSEGMSYKDFMQLIIAEIHSGNYPTEHRNNEMESRYFRNDIDINELYKNKGRMFRHLMGLCEFFGIINSTSRKKKQINFDTCRELALSKKELLLPVCRNNLLNNNINSNDYIKNLRGITVKEDSNYKPAYAILRFIKELKRPATMFEISILLGRIDDEIQNDKNILSRAIAVANELPVIQDDQIKCFFGTMGWKTEQGSLFQYEVSQEPYFKFKTFLLFMEHFELIEINNVDETVKLTEYSQNLLKDEIPVELLDLEDLLYKIDDDTESDAMLVDIILRKRSNSITIAIKNDSTLLEKLNKRSIRKIEYDKNGKKKRNKIISELAKIKADYTCEATGNKTFKMANGMYYVEAHHIIEFSTENGPDITENLIALGPEKHMLLHHACTEEREDLFNHLKTNNVLNFERFKRMHTVYNCLTKKHIQVLYNRKLISSIDRDNLYSMVCKKIE